MIGVKHCFYHNMHILFLLSKQVHRILISNHTMTSLVEKHEYGQHFDSLLFWRVSITTDVVSGFECSHFPICVDIFYGIPWYVMLCKITRLKTLSMSLWLLQQQTLKIALHRERRELIRREPYADTLIKSMSIFRSLCGSIDGFNSST